MEYSSSDMRGRIMKRFVLVNLKREFILTGAGPGLEAPVELKTAHTRLPSWRSTTPSSVDLASPGSGRLERAVGREFPSA